MEGAFEVIKDLLGGLSWDRESVYARLSQCIDSAIRSSLVIVLYKGGKEELIFANDMFYENIGEDRDGYEYKEADIKKRIKPENKVVKYEKCVEKSMLTGETQEIIYQFERYDGKVIWVRKRFAAICNEGEYIIVSVATNITKSIEISRQIEIEKDRFQKVIEQTDLAIIEWDYYNNTFYSTESYKKYKMSEGNQDRIFKKKSIIGYTHPDDVEKMKKFVSNCILTPGKMECIVRLKLIDGTYSWSKITVVSEYDIDGNKMKTLAIIADVNEDMERRKKVGIAVDIVNTLAANEYEEIFTINAFTGEPVVYKEGISKVVEEQNKVGFKLGVENYIKTYCMDENLEQTAKELNLDYVKEQLENNNTYQKIYSIMDENNNIKMKRAFYTYLNKHKDTIVCTIMEVGK